MTFSIIPAIDLLDGKVVRLSQGKYDQVSYYDFTPAELARKYEENGATRIHIVDLDGAKAGKIVNWTAIKEIRNAVTCELEIGGGIRCIETSQAVLDAGIQYLIIGSLLVKDRSSADKIIAAFPNRVIAGIDCHGDAVATEGWIHASKVSLRDLVDSLADSPISSIIFTDISTDGMLCGPNIPALKIVAEMTHHPIIASGGIKNLADVKTLSLLDPARIQGCILGKSIMENHISFSELWKTAQ